jgi:hypothetical protein
MAVEAVQQGNELGEPGAPLKLGAFTVEFHQVKREERLGIMYKASNRYGADGFTALQMVIVGRQQDLLY